MIYSSNNLYGKGFLSRGLENFLTHLNLDLSDYQVSPIKSYKKKRKGILTLAGFLDCRHGWTRLAAGRGSDPAW